MTTFGMPGIAWVMMSSRLGLVAEVIATESPSQLSPVVIQITCAVTCSVARWPGTNSISAAIHVPPSTDPRERVTHQLVHHPLATEARLHQHHARRLGLHLADVRGIGQRGEGGFGSLGRDDRDEAAFVR